MRAVVLVGLLAALGGEPFTELGFDAALVQATKEKKLLIVDFTASWCGPCRKMEKDTWADAGVRSWLAENAVAIQLDVDKERELAGKFAVESIPAIVVLREGKEADRSVGYKDPAAFLGWVKNVRGGKSSKDALLERARALEKSTDLRERYTLAQELQHANLNDDALAQYLLLWPATRGSEGWGGVRCSFLLSDMAQLARAHEPARRAFLGILVDSQSRVEEAGRRAELPSPEDWHEWTALCRYFGERPRVVTWYEANRDEAGRLFADRPAESQRGAIVSEVFDVLMTSGRPLDAVRLLEDARPRADELVARFRAMQAEQAALDEESREGLDTFLRAKLVQDLAQLYAALLAAERREEAAAVAAKLLAELDSPESRIGLVRAGLEIARRSEESFALWLDQAESSGTNVRHLRQRMDELRAPPAVRTGN